MGRDMVVSRYAIPIGIPCIDGLPRGPPEWGVTAWYESLDIQIPRAWWAWV